MKADYEWRIGKESQEVVFANFEILTQYFPGTSEENHDKHQSRYLSSGWVPNPGRPKYEAGMLSTEP